MKFLQAECNAVLGVAASTREEFARTLGGATPERERVARQCFVDVGGIEFSCFLNKLFTLIEFFGRLELPLGSNLNATHQSTI